MTCLLICLDLVVVRLVEVATEVVAASFRDREECTLNFKCTQQLNRDGVTNSSCNTL